jgi:hypothetical protein
MIPKSGNRFPAFAKPASAGEGRSEEIMLTQKIWSAAQAAGTVAPATGAFSFVPDSGKSAAAFSPA